jgi:hypothetical protein
VTEPITQWGDTIVLRSVPTRLDMGLDFTIEDSGGRRVAEVRLTLRGWQRVHRLLGGGTARYDFDVVAGDVPILTISRVRAGGWFRDPEQWEVRSPTGSHVGAFQRRDTGFRGGRRYFTLESEPDHAENARRASETKGNPIFDGSGRQFGAVAIEHGPGDRTASRLTITSAPTGAERALGLGAALAEHFHERVANHGPVNALFWWA